MPNIKTLLASVLTSRSGPPRLDSYLWWAMLTEFRYYDKPGGEFALVIECKESVQKLLAEIDQRQASWLKVPALYDRKDGDGLSAAQTRFCSARVALDLETQADQLAARLLALTGWSAIARFELSGPIQPVTGADPSFNTIVGRAADPVLGVIDDFVGFAHSDFLRTHPRTGRVSCAVRSVWSQDSEQPRGSKAWKRLSEGGYGYELTPNSLISATLDLSTAASKLRAAYPKQLKAATHGTHVASTAFSARHAVSPTSPRVTEERERYADVLAVHLPRATVRDSSGGAMPAQLLDGLRYLCAKTGSRRPLVVNISYGTHAGPHDGTSIVEAAIDELIQKRSAPLSVVIPSGNHREAMGRAEVVLTNENRTHTLTWWVLPDDRTPNFMEIWANADPGTYEITLTSPSGKRCKALAHGAPIFADDPANPTRSTAAVIAWPNTSNSQPIPGQSPRTPTLLAVAPTAARLAASVPAAEAGAWQVHLSLKKGVRDTVVFDAYIERNDTIYGRKLRGRQSRFEDSDYARHGRKPRRLRAAVTASAIKREGSFNTFATGVHTIAVAGYQSSGSRVVADYSGCGPLWTVWGVDVAAPSDESEALRGYRGAGSFGVHTVRINGTSVSAPMVARILMDFRARQTGPCTLLDDLSHLIAMASPPTAADDPYRVGAGRLGV